MRSATMPQASPSTKQEAGAFLRMLRLLSGEEQRIAYAVLEGMQLQQSLDAQRNQSGQATKN